MKTTLPTDRIEFFDPIDRIEFSDPTDRIEFFDPTHHLLAASVRIGVRQILRQRQLSDPVGLEQGRLDQGARTELERHDATSLLAELRLPGVGKNGPRCGCPHVPCAVEVLTAVLVHMTADDEMNASSAKRARSTAARIDRARLRSPLPAPRSACASRARPGSTTPTTRATPTALLRQRALSRRAARSPQRASSHRSVRSTSRRRSSRPSTRSPGARHEVLIEPALPRVVADVVVAPAPHAIAPAVVRAACAHAQDSGRRRGRDHRGAARGRAWWPPRVRRQRPSWRRPPRRWARDGSQRRHTPSPGPHVDATGRLQARRPRRCCRCSP